MSGSSHCAECPNRHRCPAVPPTLNAVGGQSDLLIIGEGPGREEVRVQKGFQGPSGQLLRKALLEAGFDQSIIASLSNATLCLPPKEGMCRAMCDACRPRLLDEIAAVNPRVILALGRWALQSLTGRQEKITAVSGLPRQWEGRWLVPSIHPASVLRHGNEMSSLQTAVDVAMELVRGQGFSIKDPGEPRYQIPDTAGQWAELRSLPEGALLGCDIETTGVNPRVDKIVAIGIAWAKNEVFVIPADRLSGRRVTALFESPHGRFRFAWHNGQFDLGFLRAAGINARIDEDSLLLHYCLDEQKGTHSLEKVACAYLGARDYKDEVAAYRKGRWDECPPDVLHRYLARDCDYTRQLSLSLREQVNADPALRGLYEGLLLPASDLLTEVSANGFYLSAAEAERVRGGLEPRRDEALARLSALAGEAINPASQPQVYALVYHRLGLRNPPKFPRNTAEPTLRAIAASTDGPGAEIIGAILDWRFASKALSSVKGLAKKCDPTDGRIHSYYPLHGTVTGRLSSREPNLQNVNGKFTDEDEKPLIKGMFQAPAGRVLLETDLDQAELRVLANLSGDEAFAAIYRAGLSLHKEVAVAMFGDTYTPDQYRQAKIVNFGIAYGLGAESLYQKFSGPAVPKEQRITLAEARSRIEAWAERFPQAWQWLQRQKAMVEVGRPVSFSSPTGRQRRFRLVTANNLVDCQNEACNFTIQATASDICLKAAIAVNPLVRSLGGKVVNLVHDSILFEMPRNRKAVEQVTAETARYFASIGAALVGELVPITCSWKLGTQWGSLKPWSINE